MRRYALVAAVLAVLAQPALSIVPRMMPDDQRLEAARRFVATLPIEESVAVRMGQPDAIRGELTQWLAERVRQDGRTDDFEGMYDAFRLEVGRRADAALPLVLPTVREELAIHYGLALRAEELDAAGRFFASAEGRAFAARTALGDKLVSQTLLLFLNAVLEPELPAILTAARADAAERRRIEEDRDDLRARVNASGGRRPRD